LKSSDDSVAQQIAVDPALVANDTLTVTWSGNLQNATKYYVLIDEGIVVSALGASYAGITDKTALTFTTAAAPPPPFQLSNTTPANQATGVSVSTNLVLTFDTDVVFGSGSISIFEAGTDALFESIPVTDTRVSVSGTTATVNPTGILNGETTYYVLVSSGSFQSTAGASFVGITSPTDFTFTTKKTFGLSSLSPLNGTTGVDMDTDLALTFTDPVKVGSGHVQVWSSADVLIESVAMDDARVSINGATVSVDLDRILAGSQSFYVTVEAGAILPATGSGSFAGFNNNSTWAFATKALSAPGSVATGLVLWLDADYAKGVKLGTGVRVWADRSGLYHNVRQATSGLQPALITSAIGSHSVVRFDGSNDTLTASDGIALSAFEGFVVWQSSKAPSTSAAAALLINGENFQVNHGDTGGASSAVVTCAGADCSQAASLYSQHFVPTPVANTAYLWDFGFDALTTSLFTRTGSGAVLFQPAPTTQPATPTTAFSVGGDADHCSSGCYFDGDIAEVLLYSRALTESERAAVTSYLQSKWSSYVPTCNSGETQGPDGGCYFFGTDSVTFDTARTNCQSRGTGWDLVSIRSKAANDFISPKIGGDAWLGVTRATGDSWRWVTDTLQFWSGLSSGTGTNSAYANWTSGQPTGGVEEGCARITTAGTWNDVGCTANYRTLCEGPGK
jgi:hypothetical protein